MNPNENWIAEQTRLIALEEGFGPGYLPHVDAPAPEVDPEPPLRPVGRTEPRLRAIGPAQDLI